MGECDVAVVFAGIEPIRDYPARLRGESRVVSETSAVSPAAGITRRIGEVLGKCIGGLELQTARKPLVHRNGQSIVVADKTVPLGLNDAPGKHCRFAAMVYPTVLAGT